MTTLTNVDKAVYLALRNLDRKLYKVDREQVADIVTYTISRGDSVGLFQVMPRPEDGAICFGTIQAMNKATEWDTIVQGMIWGELKRQFGDIAHGFGYRGWVDGETSGGEDEGKTKPPADSGHYAHSPAKRREIVTEYRRARSEREVENKDTWARAKFGISGKTLKSYEAEFPMET